MASRWLRAICTNYTYDMFSGKAVPLWLHYIMGFTIQTESCVGGNSFVSTEKNGTNGSFTGFDYTFSTSSASFAATDAIKYLIVKDSINNVNCGIYKIKKVNSATSITIDFKAGYGEFPVAATNLSWWICGKDYKLPRTTNDYIRLQSTHPSGWAIEWKSYSSSSDIWEHYIRIALTGDWSDKVLGNFFYDSSNHFTLATQQYNSSIRNVFWAEADINCNWLHLWTVTNSFSNTPYGTVHLFSFESITPTSGEVYSDYELWAVISPANNSIYDSGLRINETYPVRTVQRSWSKTLNAEIPGDTINMSPINWDNAFTKNMINPEGTSPNYRLDSKMPIFTGSFYARDTCPYYYDVLRYYSDFCIIGKMNGHLNIPWIPRHPTQLGGVGDQGMFFHTMVPMNFMGDRDKLLIFDSIVIPWCGLSVRTT